MKHWRKSQNSSAERNISIGTENAFCFPRLTPKPLERLRADAPNQPVAVLGSSLTLSATLTPNEALLALVPLSRGFLARRPCAHTTRNRSSGWARYRLNGVRLLHGSSPQEQGNGVPCARAASRSGPLACELIPVVRNESIVGKVWSGTNKNRFVLADPPAPSQAVWLLASIYPLRICSAVA